ncbi:MAG: toast rack family protein [Longimicrobiales bacterium]
MSDRGRWLALAGVAAAGVIGLCAPVSAQDWQTLSQSRKFGSEEALKVNVEYGAGRLSIAPGTDEWLYRADLRYDADVFKHPKMTYAHGALNVGLSDGNVKGRNLKAGKLDLLLGTRVPLDINLKFGAAEAQLDLGGLLVRNATIQTGASQTTLRVSRPNRIVCNALKMEVGAAKLEAIGLGNLNCEHLKLSGGVGEVTLDFSGSAKQDMTADIEMGLGSLTLRIPRGTGLKVTKGGILASFDSEGMVKRGDSFFSENWKTAQRHVTVEIDAAFGSINVEWLDR